MRSLTKAIFLIGIALIVYGYLCRELNIYFFWDSKFFGWLIIFIGITSYLFDLHRLRLKQGKKILWVNIGIAISLFCFIISVIVTFEFRDTDAYQVAIESLKTDSQIKSQIGNIKGFGLHPTGEITSTTINGAESGYATINLTIRGDKKYKDITVTLRKTPETFWTVISIK